jgi:hypothetical protein
MCASLWVSFWRGVGAVQVDCPLRPFAKISDLYVPPEICYTFFLFPVAWREQTETFATVQTGNGLKFDLVPIDGNQIKSSKVKHTGSHKLIITGQVEHQP